MDEQELQRLFEKFQSGVKLTDDEMQKLAKDASLANRALSSMGSALGSLTKHATNLGKKLYEGEQGASVYNDAIKSGTDAFGDLLGALGPLGKILGFLVKAFGGYVQEVNKLSDRLYKSYQSLSKVGVTAADGMMGLAESAQRLGYGLSEVGLENFGRLMKASAQDLALLSGSAVQGRKDFTDFASEVVRGSAGRELMNLGYSVEELNEGLASYIGLQSRVGMAQNKTQAELRAGATAYLKEMDALTKLTGLQKAELEEGINKARAVEAFRAKVEDLRAQGREKEADQMEKYYAVLQKQAPTLAQGFAEAASGLIVSDAGRQYFQAIDNGAQVIQGLSTGAMSLEQALGATYKQAKLSEGEFRQLAMAMGSSNVIGSYTELADIAKRSGIDQEEIAKTIKEAQDAQAKGPGGVAAQTDMRRAQMDSRDALQQLVKVGVGPATSAMSAFAQVTSKVVTALGGKISAAPGAPMAEAGAAPAAAGGGGGMLGAIGRGLTAMGLGPGAGTAATTMSQQDLANQGLKIKAGDVQAEGSTINPKLIEYAKRIQSEIPGFQYFSGFNDRFHQEKSPSSSHTKGLAADFTVSPTPSPEQGRDIASQLKAMGFATVIDEYNNPSAKATAGHFHAAISARNGFEGLISGPKSGYRPNIEMHGDERVSIKPASVSGAMDMDRLDNTIGEQMGVMGAQLSALENLVAIMRDQTTISTKILQASNN
jgi:hypothetical protein